MNKRIMYAKLISAYFEINRKHFAISLFIHTVIFYLFSNTFAFYYYKSFGIPFSAFSNPVSILEFALQHTYSLIFLTIILTFLSFLFFEILFFALDSRKYSFKKHRFISYFFAVIFFLFFSNLISILFFKVDFYEAQKLNMTKGNYQVLNVHSTNGFYKCSQILSTLNDNYLILDYSASVLLLPKSSITKIEALNFRPPRDLGKLLGTFTDYEKKFFDYSVSFKSVCG